MVISEGWLDGVVVSSLAAGALGFRRLGCLVLLDRLALFEIVCVSMMMFKQAIYHLSLWSSSNLPILAYTLLE